MGTKGVLGRGPKEEKPYIIPDRLLRGYFPYHRRGFWEHVPCYVPLFRLQNLQHFLMQLEPQVAILAVSKIKSNIHYSFITTILL